MGAHTVFLQEGEYFSCFVRIDRDQVRAYGIRRRTGLSVGEEGDLTGRLCRHMTVNTIFHERGNRKVFLRAEVVTRCSMTIHALFGENR